MDGIWNQRDISKVSIKRLSPLNYFLTLEELIPLDLGVIPISTIMNGLIEPIMTSSEQIMTKKERSVNHVH